jgi:hypothetical protein
MMAAATMLDTATGTLPRIIIGSPAKLSPSRSAVITTRTEEHLSEFVLPEVPVPKVRQ